MATKVKRLNTVSDVANVVKKVTWLKDVKATNTNGGSITAGSFQTRTLNTQEGDTTFCVLSSNQFTLPAGTYLIEGSAPAGAAGVHQARIRNITDSSNAIIGTVERSETAQGTTTRSMLYGTLILTSSKTFELQHYLATNSGAQAGGYSGNTGINMIFSVVKITKIETLDEAY